MKNTPENKAKFFAQYWGQKILKGIPSDEPSLGCRRVWAKNIDRGIVASYLELKPLSQITDEDALKVWEMMNLISSYPEESKKLMVKDWLQTGRVLAPQISNFREAFVFDFLRSKGYALPCMGISVEQQIEWGWLRLKSNSEAV